MPFDPDAFLAQQGNTTAGASGTAQNVATPPAERTAPAAGTGAMPKVSEAAVRQALLTKARAGAAQIMNPTGAMSNDPNQFADPNQQPQAPGAAPANFNPDTYLKQNFDETGAQRPEYARGDSANTAIPESFVDPEERLKLSFMGSHERIAAKLKEQGYQDVQFNDAGALVAKKDGLYHQYDPDATAWDTTKALLKGGLNKVVGNKMSRAESEAWSDMADVAPELTVGALMTATGGLVAAAAPALGLGAVGTAATAEAAATAGTGLAGLASGTGGSLAAQAAFAGANAAVSKQISTSLGRLAGTYTPNASQQLSDDLLEGGLMAAGVPIGAGFKFVGKGALNMLSKGFQAAADSTVGSRLTRALLGASANATDSVVDASLEDGGKFVTRHLSNLVDANTEDVNKYVFQKNVGYASKLLDVAKAGQNQFMADAKETFASQIPDAAKMETGKIIRGFQSELGQSGLLQFKKGDAVIPYNEILQGIQNEGEGFLKGISTSVPSSVEKAALQMPGGTANPLYKDIAGLSKTEYRQLADGINTIQRTFADRTLVGKAGAKELLELSSTARGALNGLSEMDGGPNFQRLAGKLYGSLDRSMADGMESEVGNKAALAQYNDTVKSFYEAVPTMGKVIDQSGTRAQIQKQSTEFVKNMVQPGQRAGAALQGSELDSLKNLFTEAGLDQHAAVLDKIQDRMYKMEGVRAFAPRLSKQGISKALMAAGSATGAAAMSGAGPAALGVFPISLAMGAAAQSPRLMFQAAQAGTNFAEQLGEPALEASGQFARKLVTGLQRLPPAAVKNLLNKPGVAAAIQTQIQGRMAGKIVDEPPQ